MFFLQTFLMKRNKDRTRTFQCCLATLDVVFRIPLPHKSLWALVVLCRAVAFIALISFYRTLAHWGHFVHNKRQLHSNLDIMTTFASFSLVDRYEYLDS